MLNVNELVTRIQRHSENDCVSIDIETTGLDRSSEIVSVAIAFDDDSGKEAFSFWVDRFHDQSIEDQRNFQMLITALLFSGDYEGTVVFHNLDFDLKFLLDRYFQNPSLSFSRLPRLADTLTISRVAKNNKFVSHADPRKLRCHSLKYLAFEMLGITHSTFEDVVDRSNIRFARRADLLRYNEADATLTLQLYKHFKTSLSPREWMYAVEIEMPHLLSLVGMNWQGVPYNVSEAEKLMTELTENADRLEAEIFKAVGRSFNIQSNPELASAIFYNQKLQYQNRSREDVVLKPLFVTEQGSTKIDLDTLKAVRQLVRANDSSSPILMVVENIIQYLQIKKSCSFIEGHLSIIRQSQRDRLYPNFSADAKSGRVKSSRPNLLGLPKLIFKKGTLESPPADLVNRSVRHLISAPVGYKVISIDISALDLSVVTFGAKAFDPNFEWREFFGSPHDIDIHLTIACMTKPDDLRKVFKRVVGAPQVLHKYWMKKPDHTGLTFIDRVTHEVIQCPFQPGDAMALSEINRLRNVAKEINLSSSYMIGANSLAVNIKKKTGSAIGADESKESLDRFYERFPAIRRFQDDIANSIYRQGYAETVFGRKFYADCFDELNEHYHGSNGFYEMLCFLGGKYWYIKARHWIKPEGSVVEEFQLTKKPFGFAFKDIVICEQLPKGLFAKRKKKISKKFNRNSEANIENLGPFELSRIGLSNEIDRILSHGTSMSSEGETAVRSLIAEGNYLIPEKSVLMFRVPLRSPNAKYFRYFTGLLKVARKFFPLFCQGFANSLAMQALTQFRQSIEAENLDARILLFIHDQIDVLVAEKDLSRAEELLKVCIESDKKPFDVPLSGKPEHPSDHIN